MKRFFPLAPLVLVCWALSGCRAESSVESSSPVILKLSGSGLERISFSPDSCYVLTTESNVDCSAFPFPCVVTSFNTTVWDMKTLHEIGTLKKEEDVPIFLKCGSQIGLLSKSTTAQGKNLNRVLDLPTLKIIKPQPKLPPDSYWRSVWPNNETLAALGSESPIHLWNVRTGVKKKIALPLTPAGDGYRLNTEFLPDHKTVVSEEVSIESENEGGGMNATCRNFQFWDTTARKRRFIVRCKEGSPYTFVATANGICAFQADRKIEVWNYFTGIRKRTFAGHYGYPTLSPDGSLLAMINTPNSGSGTNIELWNVNSGQRLRLIQSRLSGFNIAAFSPDGRTLACGSNRYIQLWRIK